MGMGRKKLRKIVFGLVLMIVVDNDDLLVICYWW